MAAIESILGAPYIFAITGVNAQSIANFNKERDLNNRPCGQFGRFTPSLRSVTPNPRIGLGDFKFNKIRRGDRYRLIVP